MPDSNSFTRSDALGYDLFAASVCQDKPGSSRKLKGAYPWNDPFIKVAAQACGIGVIRVTKPCKANSRAAAQANLIQPR